MLAHNHLVQMNCMVIYTENEVEKKNIQRESTNHLVQCTRCAISQVPLDHQCNILNSFRLIQTCTACCNTNWLVPVGISFNLFVSISFPFIQLLNVDHIIIFQWLNINSIVEQLITGFSLFFV